MKITFRIMLIFFILVALLVVGISAYVLTNARKILVSELEKNLGVKVKAASVAVSLPASVVVRQVALGESVKVEKIYVSLSPLQLLFGTLGFKAITLEKPQFQVTRHLDNIFDFGITLKPQEPTAPAAGAPPAEPGKQKKVQKPKVFVQKIKIVDGKLTFLDKTISPNDPFVLNFTRINLDIASFSLLAPTRMPFEASADVTSQLGQPVGKVKASGWLDILSKDMDAKVDCSDIQMAMLRPYYERYLKKELESGKLVLALDLKSKANDLVAKCHIDLSEVRFKQEPVEEGAQKQATSMTPSDLTVLAIDSVLSSQGAAVFDFSVRTKMDNPKFENVQISQGSFFQSKAKELMSQVSGQDMTDFKKIGEQFESIGKEFKKIFKGE
ncbi:MAG: DUF748 domain-containing protein [Candidatus Omnitrophota bacterium]